MVSLGPGPQLAQLAQLPATAVRFDVGEAKMARSVNGALRIGVPPGTQGTKQDKTGCHWTGGT